MTYQIITKNCIIKFYYNFHFVWRILDETLKVFFEKKN